MPVRRTPIKRQALGQIDAAVVWHFICAKEILSDGDADLWEHEGGRRQEYLDLSESIEDDLNLRPWQLNPVLLPSWRATTPWRCAASLSEGPRT